MEQVRTDASFRDYWDIAQQWSEQSRYRRHESSEARALVESVGSARHGVLRWIKQILVATDFAAGSRILEILDDARLRVNVAMWLRTPEYEDWRFVLSSRVLDGLEPAAAYGRVHDELGNAGFLVESTPPLLLLKTRDPFIRALRLIFGKKNVEGVRLGGQTLGDRFIEDAIVYRVR